MRNGEECKRLLAVDFCLVKVTPTARLQTISRGKYLNDLQAGHITPFQFEDMIVRARRDVAVAIAVAQPLARIGRSLHLMTITDIWTHAGTWLLSERQVSPVQHDLSTTQSAAWSPEEQISYAD